MTIDEMKQLRRVRGYTYAMLAEKSGVPISTVQKIFGGETVSPRFETLQSLSKVFTEKDEVNENATYRTAYGVQKPLYTIEDYYQLPVERRVELIDGEFYNMSAPSSMHQVIAGEIYRQIANFILKHGGNCISMISPVDVRLDSDEYTMIQPDVLILCDKDKLQKWGIDGNPDFVLEILSPSTRRKDCIKKLSKYENAGVREYWILDTVGLKLMVYFFEQENYPIIYGLDASVPVNIYNGELIIELQNINKWIGDNSALFS